MFFHDIRNTRGLVRDAITALMIGVTSPCWILAWLERRVSASDELFTAFSQLLSLIPGKSGVFVRRGYYAMTLDVFAWDAHLGFGTILAHRTVEIHRGVYIGARCMLGSVRIERDVTMGSNVDVLSGRHQHGFLELGKPIQTQQGQFIQTTIARNCWIGNSAVIMADIGHDSVIGAGSVVVRPIPACVVAVGNPCATIRSRVQAEEPVVARSDYANSKS